ncbi:hypothetical protein Ddc_12684 [Ditylenchus destructor]|nr:hypothetical protein Ddc_12684 [Ditylenchus destructor]
MVLIIYLSLLLLCCNAIFASSECPKYEDWQNKTTSPEGPLVCAMLYGDSSCAGFPLPFGINSSSSNLGSDSSPVINFYTNSITALVRPGCKMYLWEGTNFTGQSDHSFGYKWNIEQLKYRSALCECTIDDPDLLKCEMREQWEQRNFCDLRESDVGGSCSFTLMHSFIEDESDNETNTVKNVTITDAVAEIFAEKMLESFGEKRIFSFLDTNKSDTSPHIVIVDPRSSVSIKQRSYVCGKYHLFTQEIARILSLGYLLRDKWIYNPQYVSYYWFSSETQTQAGAENKCSQLGGHLAEVRATVKYSLRKWMTRFMIGSTNWWTVAQSNVCAYLKFNENNDAFGWEQPSTTGYYGSTYASIDACLSNNFNYICEKEANI